MHHKSTPSDTPRSSRKSYETAEFHIAEHRPLCYQEKNKRRTAIRRSLTEVEPGNRRLIRPVLSADTKDSRPRKDGLAKKVSPPDQTNAENFYYLKQMQSKTPMTIVMKDGEELKGVIEWYDKCCLKVNRDGAPNLLVYKSNIKYMHKA